jgi:hypothetical protein
MYDNVVMSVWTSDGDRNDFPFNIGLQESSLSHYIFAFVMDEVTRDIQGDIPWCMLFVDDVILEDESRTEVDGKLDLWRWTLKAKDFRFSRSKMLGIMDDWIDWWIIAPKGLNIYGPHD